jgi:putative hydrolase of the HAD superfamily
MTPRAILFDLDDTILSYGSRPLLLLEVAEEFRASLGPIEPAALADLLEARFEDFWADADRHASWRQRMGEARRLVVRDAFAGLRGVAPGLSEAEADRFALRFHAWREERLRPFPDAAHTIDALKRRGVKLALVTNGDAYAQRAKIARFDLARHFDHIQIEGEAGFGKPDARAYLHAMRALEVGPHETWMVGDNLEWEVAAPQRLGIFSIWHDHVGAGLPPGSSVIPDLIIVALGALLDALGEDASIAARGR